MWDRQTESLVAADHRRGDRRRADRRQLDHAPGDDRRAGRPSGRSSRGAGALARDRASDRAYGRNPYVGYDDIDTPPFLYDGPLDGRLPPKERVVTVSARRRGTPPTRSPPAEQRVIADTGRRRRRSSCSTSRGPPPRSTRRRSPRRATSARRASTTRRWTAGADLHLAGWRVRGPGDRQHLECARPGNRWPAGGQAARTGRPRQPLLVRLGGLQAADAHLRGTLRRATRPEVSERRCSFSGLTGRR